MESHPLTGYGKIEIILMGFAVAAALVASLLIQRRTQARLGENGGALRQQESQLAELVAESQRLSNLLAQAKTNSAKTDDQTDELGRNLRAEAEALRKQTNQLAKQLAEQRHLTEQLAEQRRRAGARTLSSGDSKLLEHNKELGISFAGGPRATGKLNDARAITEALRNYAGEHQGEFPPSLDPVASHLPEASDANSPPWANAPLSGTNDFEIVYQGSQTDLTNIPLRRVALIRERQPWLTSDGKWARVYGYADGAASIVESDDNFQSWDAQHVIPPQHGRQ